MVFIRRKRGQVLVVHNLRRPEGKVHQHVLHRFSTPAELAETLGGGIWKEWCRAMGWRYPDHRFPWSALRERLAQELNTWQVAPSGAMVRRAVRIAKLVGEVQGALSGLSAGKAADEELLEELGPDLEVLHGTLERLLCPPHPTHEFPKEKGMEPETRTADAEARSESDELFNEGMEFWWAGDRPEACRCFRRVLQLDPRHADANNHLGIACLDRGRLKDAGRFFESAIEGGIAEREMDGDLAPWAHLENRPGLRGLANLGLVRSRQRRHWEAIVLYEELLALNPNDNQGIRYLIGGEHHRLGHLEEAIECYENALEEPGVCYGLALALHQAGREDQVGVALLRAFAGNRYVAPMLLGEPWERLHGWHGTNMAEPEWAADYVQREGGLWRKARTSARVLRRWWQADPVRAWMDRIAGIQRELGDLPPGEQRGTLMAQWRALEDEDHLLKLARRIDPRARGGSEQGTQADSDEP